MTEIRGTGRSVIGVGIATSTMCLAYFYVLDRHLFSSSHFSPIFKFLLLADANTAWVAAAVCFLAALWNWPDPILRLVRALGNHIVCVAVASVILLAVGVVMIYHDYPVSMDEYSAVFQAKIFAAGRLTSQIPVKYVDWLVVRGFNGQFLIASHTTGRVVEAYWPGFALILAPFEFFRAPWLCNPTLAGVALFLVHWITNEITKDKSAAGWAVLFALSSGVFAADAISYYSLQAHMSVNLLFAALLMRPSAGRAFGAGIAGSLALILHNPIPHTLFALPWLLAMALDKKQRRFLSLLALGYLPGLAIGIGWLELRLDISSAGQAASTVDGLISGVFTWPNSSEFNLRAASAVKMWLWAVPCLFIFAVSGAVRYGGRESVRLLSASAILTFLGYLFVTFDQGHGWGYRYFHSAWAVIPILAACGMTDRPNTSLRRVSFAGAAAVLSLLIIVPVQMSQIREFIGQHIAQLGSPKRPGNNVYFIHPDKGFYTADMVQIDPFLRTADLFLMSRGAELDTKMILTNWPDAAKIDSRGVDEQWYLGPLDRRRALAGKDSAERFFFLEAPD